MTAEELMQEIRGYLALNEKERAVVEAAVAYLRVWKPDHKDANELHARFIDMMVAVEAVNAERENP